MKTAKTHRVNPKRTLNTISIVEVVLSAILGRERLERMFRFRLSEIDHYKVETEEISVKKGKVRYSLCVIYFKNHSEKITFHRHE